MQKQLPKRQGAAGSCCGRGIAQLHLSLTKTQNQAAGLISTCTCTLSAVAVQTSSVSHHRPSTDICTSASSW